MNRSIPSSLALVPVLAVAGCCNTSKPDGCCLEEAKSPTSIAAVEPMTKPVEVSFLYLDVSVCEPCQGTERGLAEALAAVRGLGLEVKVERVHVDSAERARKLGFQSSPTIRVNGRDIAPIRESACGTCSDLAGTATSCRVWAWRGRDYSAAPKELIVDAILRAAYGSVRTESEPERELSENLARFFEHKAKPTATPVTASNHATKDAPCCDKNTCCR